MLSGTNSVIYEGDPAGGILMHTQTDRQTSFILITKLIWVSVGCHLILSHCLFSLTFRTYYLIDN